MLMQYILCTADGVSSVTIPGLKGSTPVLHGEPVACHEDASAHGQEAALWSWISHTS